MFLLNVGFINCTVISINHYLSRKIGSPYSQSITESKICKNRFVENDDYIKVGIRIDIKQNTKLVLFLVILVCWLSFTSIACLLKVTNYRKESNPKTVKWASLGFSAAIFIDAVFFGRWRKILAP